MFGVKLAEKYKDDETAFLENLYNLVGAGVNTSESVPAALAIAYYGFDVKNVPPLCKSWRRYRYYRSYGDCHLWGGTGMKKIPEEYVSLIQKANQVDFEHYADAIEEKRGRIHGKRMYSHWCGNAGYCDGD